MKAASETPFAQPAAKDAEKSKGFIEDDSRNEAYATDEFRMQSFKVRHITMDVSRVTGSRTNPHLETQFCDSKGLCWARSSFTRLRANCKVGFVLDFAVSTYANMADPPFPFADAACTPLIGEQTFRADNLLAHIQVISCAKRYSHDWTICPVRYLLWVVTK